MTYNDGSGCCYQCLQYHSCNGGYHSNRTGFRWYHYLLGRYTIYFDAGIHDNYLWSTGENAQQIDISTQGTFSVIVTDGNGCKGSDTITTRLSVTPQPVIIETWWFALLIPRYCIQALERVIYGLPALLPILSLWKIPGLSVTVTNSDGCIGESSRVQTILSDPLNLMIGGGDGFAH